MVQREAPTMTRRAPMAMRGAPPRVRLTRRGRVVVLAVLILVAALMTSLAAGASRAADVTAEKRCRALERPLRVTARFLVTERRVVDAGRLQIGCYLDVSNRQKPDSRVVHFSRDEIRDFRPQLIGDTVRSCSLTHD